MEQRRGMRRTYRLGWLATSLLLASAGVRIVHLLLTSRWQAALPDKLAAFAALASLPLLVVADREYRRTRRRVMAAFAELGRRPGEDGQHPGGVDEKRARVQAVLDDDRSMVIAYQPIIDLEHDAVVGMEALARFADGRSPAVWFQEAHDVGLGVALEVRAITLALDAVIPGYLSLNVSPATLADPALALALARCEGSRRLVLELTEHTVVEDYASLTGELKPLRQAGVRIAVDDAGSGFSSMRHILDLRPDIVKLDRALVNSINHDTGRQALAASLVAFARTIGADLVAEGVELDEELDACQRLGIRYAQGYLLGRPAPLDASSATSTVRAVVTGPAVLDATPSRTSNEAPRRHLGSAAV